MKEFPDNLVPSRPENKPDNVIHMRDFIQGLAGAALARRSAERLECDDGILEHYESEERRQKREAVEILTEVLPAITTDSPRQDFDIQETDQLESLETDEL